MSVMQCDRINCNHVMCDRCILGNTHYICNDCWDELLEFKKTWPGEMSALDVESSIRDFMDTVPGKYKKLNPCDINKEFDRLTGQQNNEDLCD